MSFVKQKIELLVEYCGAPKLNRAGLARMCRFDAATISRWETHGQLSDHAKQRIKETVGVEPDFFDYCPATDADGAAAKAVIRERFFSHLVKTEDAWRRFVELTLPKMRRKGDPPSITGISLAPRMLPVGQAPEPFKRNSDIDLPAFDCDDLIHVTFWEPRQGFWRQPDAENRRWCYVLIRNSGVDVNNVRVVVPATMQDPRGEKAWMRDDYRQPWPLLPESGVLSFGTGEQPITANGEVPGVQRIVLVTARTEFPDDGVAAGLASTTFPARQARRNNPLNWLAEWLVTAIDRGVADVQSLSYYLNQPDSPGDAEAG